MKVLAEYWLTVGTLGVKRNDLGGWNVDLKQYGTGTHESLFPQTLKKQEHE